MVSMHWPQPATQIMDHEKRLSHPVGEYTSCCMSEPTKPMLSISNRTTEGEVSMDIARSRLVIGVLVNRGFRRQDGLGLTFILEVGVIFGGGVMASSNEIVECVLGTVGLPWP